MADPSSTGPTGAGSISVARSISIGRCLIPACSFPASIAKIRFQNGGYWLHDVSTNGTIVNKSDRRVQSPYLLADGDELQIGDYIVSVSIAGLDVPKSKMPAQTPQPAGLPLAAGEVWAGTETPLPPIRRRTLFPRFSGRRAPQIS